MPETEGSRRRAALPAAATVAAADGGSGGRACLRCRHSTHARREAHARVSGARASEREREERTIGRGCDEDATNRRQQPLQRDDGAGGWWREGRGRVGDATDVVGEFRRAAVGSRVNVPSAAVAANG